MSDRFNPNLFAVMQSRQEDPDADWMRIAEKLPVTREHPAKKQALYIPAISRAFLRSVALCGDSLELLLVALAEMRMRGTREIAIGPGLWAQVGNPSKRVRVRLLRQIAQLPASICTLEARNGRPHLLTAGADWPKPFR